MCGVLRPERIVLHTGSAGLPARVTEAIYLGQSVRYHLRLADGPDLIAVSPDQGDRHDLGSTVRVSWRSQDVWILPDDRGATTAPSPGMDPVARGPEGNLEIEGRTER